MADKEKFQYTVEYIGAEKRLVPEGEPYGPFELIIVAPNKAKDVFHGQTGGDIKSVVFELAPKGQGVEVKQQLLNAIGNIYAQRVKERLFTVAEKEKAEKFNQWIEKKVVDPVRKDFVVEISALKDKDDLKAKIAEKDSIAEMQQIVMGALTT